MLKAIEKNAAWTARCRIWFDMGTREGAQVESFGTATRWTRRLADFLTRDGRTTDVDFHYAEVKDGQHNEAAWAARFDDVLLFLYGKH